MSEGCHPHCGSCEEAVLPADPELILGLHVYRHLSPTRFACSLMPSGAVGVVDFKSISLPHDAAPDAENPLITALPHASPENPVTLVFQKAIPGDEIAWSSEQKCFVCNLQKVQVVVVV